MTVYKLPKAEQKYFDEEYWELTDQQLDQLVKSDETSDRKLAACFGRDQDLDKLVSDLVWSVRAVVVQQGPGSGNYFNGKGAIEVSNDDLPF